jgi:hypothetical protein
MYCYSASKIAFVAQQCETDTLSATDATCLCSFDPILGRRSFTTYTRSVTRPIVGLVRGYAAVIHRRVNTTYVSRLVTSHIIREMPEAAAPAQPLPHPSSTNYRYGSLLAVDGFRQRTSACCRWTPQTGRSGFGHLRPIPDFTMPVVKVSFGVESTCAGRALFRLVDNPEARGPLAISQVRTSAPIP